MAQPPGKPRQDAVSPALTALSPAETARYTSDLLDSLRKIAMRQGHGVLAHLLDLAQYEAQSLAVKSRTPDSRDAGHSARPAPAPAEP
jgi:hypothetical protein